MCDASAHYGGRAVRSVTAAAAAAAARKASRGPVHAGCVPRCVTVLDA